MHTNTNSQDMRHRDRMHLFSLSLYVAATFIHLMAMHAGKPDRRKGQHYNKTTTTDKQSQMTEWAIVNYRDK